MLFQLNSAENSKRILPVVIGFLCMAMAHAGVIVPVAGNGSKGYGGNGGPASAATLSGPSSLVFDTKGNLYISDADNNVVRKVDGQGQITTVVGTGQPGYTGDGGSAVSATLSAPAGLAIDANGTLYISELNNHVVRAVTANGQIRTVAGNHLPEYSGDGGKATSASLNGPAGITVDAAGNLYIADQNNNAIRKVDGQGQISTFAGNGTNGRGGDGGPATSAMLAYPWGVTADRAGNVYITDTNNYTIRRVDKNGVITTVAGNGVTDLAGYFGDGGPAVSARLYSPRGLATDIAGNLYIVDTGNRALRVVDGSGIIRGVAGTGRLGDGGDGGFSNQATFTFPIAAAVDSNGDVYIADNATNRVRKVVGGTAQLYTAISGSLSAQSIALTISPPGGLSTQAGAEFIAALLPNNQLYLMGATGWVPFDANRPAAYAANLQALTVPVANGNDLTGIKGTTLYAGYGRGATAAQSFLDMLTNLTLLKVGTVQ